MKLETRLEKLEHEFKILKNEIQATLLEIREQLLTQQYPALRAEEGAAGHAQHEYPASTGAPLRSDAPERMERAERPGRVNAMPRPEAPLASHSNGSGSISHRRNASPPVRSGSGLRHAETPAFTDLRYEDQFGDEVEGHYTEEIFSHAADRFGEDSYGDDPDDDHGDAHGGDPGDLSYDDGSPTGAPFSPHTREVSLSEIKRAHGEPGTIRSRPSSGRNTPPRPNFAALAEWVGLGVRTIGNERTRQAVETYAASGYVSPDAQKTIVQLLALSPEEEPVEQPSPTATIELLVKLDAILNAG